jgi:hypothetical protein
VENPDAIFAIVRQHNEDLRRLAKPQLIIPFTGSPLDTLREAFTNLAARARGRLTQNARTESSAPHCPEPCPGAVMKEA